MADVFPEAVQRFILENINSVEQLEVLLLLKNNPAKEWTAETVSQALYTTPQAAVMRLNDLAARGLLAARQEAELLYRYAPAAVRDALVQSLAEAYRERRVAVITLIYSKPHDQVQAFADAFKLRKDK